MAINLHALISKSATNRAKEDSCIMIPLSMLFVQRTLGWRLFKGRISGCSFALSNKRNWNCSNITLSYHTNLPKHRPPHMQYLCPIPIDRIRRQSPTWSRTTHSRSSRAYMASTRRRTRRHNARIYASRIRDRSCTRRNNVYICAQWNRNNA